MSKKKRKSYSREFKLEAVGLITEKGYSIAEASRNLGIDYSVLRRWTNQLANVNRHAEMTHLSGESASVFGLKLKMID